MEWGVWGVEEVSWRVAGGGGVVVGCVVGTLVSVGLNEMQEDGS